MPENVFRILAGLIFLSGVGISTYFRRKADREMYETDQRLIKEALEDFAEEHDGHV